MAPWIISNFPEHRFYIEPFGGAASVLLRKPRSFSEVYNDIDGDLVNLLSVLRDADGRTSLIESIKLTPFSRHEFEMAKDEASDPIENARRMVVRSFMGFGSAATNKNHSTGFRSKSHRKTTTAGSDWFNYPESLLKAGERLRGVIIERRNAVDLIDYHDDAEALFYVDPPYLHETRHEGSERCYAHEMGVSDHESLLSKLAGISGHALISGYDNEMYNDVLSGWQKEYKAAAADGRGKRTEVLWIKPIQKACPMRMGAYQTHKTRTSRNEEKIIDALDLAKSRGDKVSKSLIAKMVGLSREQVSRRYAHLFDSEKV